MGLITESKETKDNGQILKIILKEKELKNLKGHLKRIRIFSSDLCTKETCIHKRGNNGVTKYFKIPLGMRLRKKKTKTISYQKIDSSDKTFYIYNVEKLL